MYKKLLFLSVIHSFYLFGMENDNNSLISKDSAPEIIKYACYFILHRHFENKKCLRHAEPSCLEIESQECSASNNLLLQDYFKEPQYVLIFYNQDKQPLLENVSVFAQKEHAKKKLLKMAKGMLDPNFKPRAMYAIQLVGSMPLVLHLFDQNDELVMHFIGFENNIRNPLTEDQKRDLSQFVKLADDFTIRTPEPKGCCNAI